MQLLLNTFGAASKKDNMFLVRAGERQALISPRKVQSIVLTTGVHLSTDAIRLALEHHIDIALWTSSASPTGGSGIPGWGRPTGCGAGCSRSPRPRTASGWPANGSRPRSATRPDLLRELARTRPDRADELEAVAGRLEKMADIVAGLKGPRSTSSAAR